MKSHRNDGSEIEAGKTNKTSIVIVIVSLKFAQSTKPNQFIERKREVIVNEWTRANRIWAQMSKKTNDEMHLQSFSLHSPNGTSKYGAKYESTSQH